MYCGETTFRGFHDPSDILGLTRDQLDFFANPKIKRVEDIFARYYLIRTEDFTTEIKDGLDEWIYFFKNGQVQGNVQAKGLEKAKERLRVSSLDSDDLAAYKEYLKLLSSDASYEAQMKFEIQQAVTEAVAEAAAKAELEKENMILGMVKAGLPANQIALITQKTEEDVQRIIAKHKK